MTASLNVFGNVREYDTDQDVFGNVFEWPFVVVIPQINSGWQFGPNESVFFFQSSTNVFMIDREEQLFSFEES